MYFAVTLFRLGMLLVESALGFVEMIDQDMGHHVNAGPGKKCRQYVKGDRYFGGKYFVIQHGGRMFCHVGQDLQKVYIHPGKSDQHKAK